ncbi:MAG: ABC transporter ATP-binding protein [Actinomycetes bacterium]
MTDRGNAVEVRDVSKMFRLATGKRSSLKELVVRGRERYSEFWALRDVTLDVPKGSTFGLIGHNGSGKSTLLKLMAGIHRPTTGTITHQGRVSALLELGAGFHPELTGRDNIYLNGSILGMTRRRIDAALERIVEFSGLGEFIDVPVKVYSSGMYARLGFSIAVHLDPEILIVDEILAVGDEDFQRRCYDYLAELRHRGVTIIFVSHSLGTVQNMCDEVAWLDHGRLLERGPAVKVVDAYLEQVNAVEAERIAQSMAAEQQEQPPEKEATPSRRGSGEIRVQGIELLRDGEEVSAGTTGWPLTIRVNYVAYSPVRDPVFALGIYTEQGHKVAGPHTGASDLGIVEGTGHVDFTMAELPLQPGRWELSIGVTDRGFAHAYDHVIRGYEFKVQSRAGIQDVGGDVVLEGAWSAAEETEPAVDGTRPRSLRRREERVGGPESIS